MQVSFLSIANFLAIVVGSRSSLPTTTVLSINKDAKQSNYTEFGITELTI